ncbi:MAG TPA: ribulokinase, partial [Spirochaetia bacterium]|nr:ribulokinase [Spirochaetia bacterium]
MRHYSIGLDYGTNSVRALVVDAADGREIATSVWEYAHGDHGVVIDPKNPNLARQHPQDYLDGFLHATTQALRLAEKETDFDTKQVIGIGVDTTGSTPIPVDASGEPLAFKSEFADNPAALAWLWKDHTSVAEAEEITALARKLKPEYLAKCGGTYSSEWYWAKMLHCKRTAPAVFQAAHTWVEFTDWVPAVLTGTSHPDKLRRGVCAAGHKAMYHESWGGYPEEDFLSKLDPELIRVRRTLPPKTYSVDEAAGELIGEWAAKLGLPAGIPVAIGAFDAHIGGIGSGIRPGTLVKTIGTSTCDLMVAPLAGGLADIPGLCGIVPGSILPGNFGMEAGQSAVGDILNWFVEQIRPGGDEAGGHAALTHKAAELKPGESGLLALDWENGNRTILVDQRLTGLILGLSLHSSPAEIYRALIEATAFGSRIIMERFEEYEVKVERVVACGGIPQKNELFMQIYADVMGREVEVSKSSETCALGSAMAGAVVAGSKAGGYDSFDAAEKKMTGVLSKKY